MSFTALDCSEANKQRLALHWFPINHHKIMKCDYPDSYPAFYAVLLIVFIIAIILSLVFIYQIYLYRKFDNKKWKNLLLQILVLCFVS